MRSRNSNPPETCTLAGCETKHRAKGLCAYHYQRAQTAPRRDLIGALKLDAGCADCGYNSHAAALDFDHVRGSAKRFNISEHGHKVSLPSLIDELAKCQVVCANCHRIRTQSRTAV